MRRFVREGLTRVPHAAPRRRASAWRMPADPLRRWSQSSFGSGTRVTRAAVMRREASLAGTREARANHLGLRKESSMALSLVDAA